MIGFSNQWTASREDSSFNYMNHMPYFLSVMHIESSVRNNVQNVVGYNTEIVTVSK